MWLALGFLGIALTAQIPPPVLGANVDLEFKAKRRAILGREQSALGALADRLDREKKREPAIAVRKLMVRATDSDAFIRFTPLPELVPAGDGKSERGSGNPPGTGTPAQSATASAPWELELEKIRQQAAAELLDLGRQAASATPPHWALAVECTRNALERDPNQPEARRLLGFESYEGGWARSFAIRQLRQGYVLHPTYGWVPRSWVANLDAGQLPSPAGAGRNSKVRWLPPEEADRLRADGNPPWTIVTEHFVIQSNVPLSESIIFGRRLEAFYDLFFTVMADVVRYKLPLAKRFHDPSLRGEGPYPPHLVYYFANKDQYLNRLRNIAPPDIDRSLGYYDPLTTRGQKNRKPAYFYRDTGGQIEGIATLYHEVSHQLLFESVGGQSYKKNAGNYWVFEGLGTFFETVETHPDGTMSVGGFVGPRISRAVEEIAGRRNAIPTELFVSFGQDTFNLESQIYANYQQAMALTLFLMRWRDGIYRDAFLDYIADALKGSLKVNAGRTLQDRLGEPYTTIDAQFLEFLEARDAATRKPERKE